MHAGPSLANWGIEDAIECSENNTDIEVPNHASRFVLFTSFERRSRLNASQPTTIRVIVRELINHSSHPTVIFGFLLCVHCRAGKGILTRDC